MKDNFELETNGLTTYYIKAQRVVCSEKAKGMEVLLKNTRRQAVLEAKECCRLEPGGYVLLDFGRELQGGIDLTLGKSPDETKAKVRLVFGESVMEALSEIGVKNATNNHSPRDFVLPAPNMSHFKAGSTGFRFVKVQAVDTSLELVGVQGVLEIRDIPYRGAFECSDPLLNEIWKTGAYTVHLNMQEYVWDGIKRDRLVWIGDMHPEVSTIRCVFGADDCVTRSLDLAREEAPIGSWMNGIPSYSLWWLIIQYDWYLQTGDLDYLKAQREYITRLISQVLAGVQEDGGHHFFGGWDFADWSSNHTPYAETGVHSICIMALEKAALLCGYLSEPELAVRCQEAVRVLRQFQPVYDGNKQIAALTALSGLAEAVKVNETVLAPGNTQGLSTFFGYYVLQAKAQAGDLEGALDLIRGYWGKMLEFGATTFWEDFDAAWTENAVPIDQVVPEGKDDIHGDFGRFCYKNFRHSLCHGWASGPTPFLSQYVMGIQILEPGCRRVRIRPNLGGLSWVKGKYPTPFGEIEVEHRMEQGRVETRYTAPPEITVEQ